MVRYVPEVRSKLCTVNLVVKHCVRGVSAQKLSGGNHEFDSNLVENWV